MILMQSDINAQVPPADSNPADSNPSDPNNARMPAAQDAAQVTSADMQTNPPSVPLPLTSTTGQGFNAPDTPATPAVDLTTGQTLSGQSAPASSAMPSAAPDPQVGNIDRDALDGERAPAGSQVNAEAVASTGPV